MLITQCESVSLQRLQLGPLVFMGGKHRIHMQPCGRVVFDSLPLVAQKGFGKAFDMS